MNSRFVLLGAMLCIMIVSQTSAQCLCAEKGMDFCSCGAAVPSPPPRPAPKLVERFGITKFPPIGDSCYCGKQLVQPAVPPKPSCKVCDTFEWLNTLKTLVTKKLLNTAIAVKTKCLGHLQSKLEKFEALTAEAAEPAPVYVLPQPQPDCASKKTEPVFVLPKPDPVYAVLKPTPTYTLPKPAPAYVVPKPAPISPCHAPAHPRVASLPTAPDYSPYFT